MMNYNQVPSIITGKDLDYLSDMFEWNYGAFKRTNNALKNVNDVEICEIFNKTCNLFLNNMHSILNVLEGGSHE